MTEVPPLRRTQPTPSGGDGESALPSAVAAGVDPRVVAAWCEWLDALATDAEAALAAAMAYKALDSSARDLWLSALEQDADRVRVPRIAMYAPLLSVESDPGEACAYHRCHRLDRRSGHAWLQAACALGGGSRRRSHRDHRLAPVSPVRSGARLRVSARRRLRLGAARSDRAGRRCSTTGRRAVRRQARGDRAEPAGGRARVGRPGPSALRSRVPGGLVDVCRSLRPRVQQRAAGSPL